MRRLLSIIGLICVGGCLSTAPIIPPRYQLGVPEARADISSNGIVLIGSSAAQKRAYDGNVYTIRWDAVTNCNSDDTNNAAVIAANAILASNVWPSYRQHIRLSVDGGITWPYRIGYGVPTPKQSLGSEWEWSPPDDYAMLTTNARLRLFDLDGVGVNGPQNGLPCDITNGITSAEFAICGAKVDLPAEGVTIFNNAPLSIRWRQVGGGSHADLYALTPDSQSLIATFSNVINGVNTREIYLSPEFPTAPEMRFAIRGVEYPVIVGYSGTFEVMQ